MPGGHAAVVITTATKQKLARFLASGFDVIIDGLPRLLCQLKPDGPTGLLLPYRRAIDRIPARRNVLDPKCDDIAAPQLAVDREIEHRQVARPPVHLQSGTDRPNMFWPQRRLLADELSLVPGLASRRRGHRLRFRFHGHPPGLVRRDQDAGRACPDEQPTSAFDALPSCGCPQVRARRPRLTRIRTFGLGIARIRVARVGSSFDAEAQSKIKRADTLLKMHRIGHIGCCRFRCQVFEPTDRSS